MPVPTGPAAALPDPADPAGAAPDAVPHPPGPSRRRVPLTARDAGRPVLAALDAWRADGHDGRLRVLFLDPDGGVLAGYDLSEPAGTADELFVRDLLASVEAVGAPAVVIAVARPDGSPTRSDRQACRRIWAAFAGAATTLVDVLVVGPQHSWSFRRWHDRKTVPGEM